MTALLMCITATVAGLGDHQHLVACSKPDYIHSHRESFFHGLMLLPSVSPKMINFHLTIYPCKSLQVRHSIHHSRGVIQ